MTNLQKIEEANDLITKALIWNIDIFNTGDKKICIRDILEAQNLVTRTETIKEVIELLESTIEKERYSGAPCALDKVIYFLNQKDNERN